MTDDNISKNLITVGWVVPLNDEVWIAFDEYVNSLRGGFLYLSSVIRDKHAQKALCCEITPWKEEFKYKFRNMMINETLEKVGFWEEADKICILLPSIPSVIRENMMPVAHKVCSQHYYDEFSQAEELKRQMMTRGK